jgi:hypothetical protein
MTGWLVNILETLKSGIDLNESKSRGFEVKEINTFWVFFGAGAFVISAVLLFLISVPYFQNLTMHFVSVDERKMATPFSHQKVETKGPQLQANETTDLQNYLKKESKLLSTYGWIDSRAGVVHIPIDRAIDILTHSKETK